MIIGPLSSSILDRATKLESDTPTLAYPEPPTLLSTIHHILASAFSSSGDREGSQLVDRIHALLSEHEQHPSGMLTCLENLLQDETQLTVAVE